MKIRPVDVGVVLAAGLVVLLVSLLPSPRDQNSVVPGDAQHRAVTSEKDCVACHRAGASRPLLARHPTRKDCFRCHRSEESGD